MATGSPPLLEGKPDAYSGLLLDSAALPSEPAEFSIRLAASLAAWAAAGKRGIWLKLEPALAPLIPVALQQGARFHSAEEGYVMLTFWLPKEGKCSLPPNASHQVGIGAFVFDSKRNLLVVQENNGPLKGMNVWKMPTGLVLQGEEIWDAAVREVREETGVQTVFRSLLAIRHAHRAAVGGKGDLFFLCALQPISSQSPRALRPQAAEIAAVRWMPLDEYLAQPFFAGTELYSAINQLGLAAAEAAAAEAASGGAATAPWEMSAVRPSADGPGAGAAAVPAFKLPPEGPEDASAASGGAAMSGLGAPLGQLGFGARSLPMGYRPGNNTLYFGKL